MPLYHFTDPRNLLSIRRIGLFSWHQLELKRIQHFPASNELSRNLDTAKNLHNYVRLCLRPQHPMATRALMDGRIRAVVWLTIDDVVTRWRATLFSDRNAAARAAIINHNPQTAFGSNDPQAEVLIEGSLARRWIAFPQEPQSRSVSRNSPPF